MRESRRYARAAAVAAVILATALRLAQLGAESLWLEEAFSVGVVQQRSYTWLLFELPNLDPYPPAHYLLLKPWIAIVGGSAFATRLLSVLLGVGTVALVYCLGRVLFERRTGVVGAGLVAIAPLHIWYAQEVRMYALLAFLAAATTLALVRLSRRFTQPRAVAYVLGAVVMGYTHTFGLLVILAHAIFVVSRPRLPGDDLQLSTRNWLRIHGPVGVLLLPWAYPLLPGQQEWIGVGTWGEIEVPDPGYFYQTLELFAAGQHLDPSLDLATPDGLPVFLVGLCGLFVLIGLFREQLENARVLGTDSELSRLRAGITIPEEDQPALWLLAVLFVVPLLAAYALSVVADGLLELRYTIPASLGFYLLVARGAGKVKVPPIQLPLVAILVVGLLVPMPAYYVNDQKGQWNEAASYVEGYADEDDLVIIAPAYAWWPWHAAAGEGPDIRTAGPGTSDATIREWIRGYDRVFLVFRFPGPETRERFRAVLDASDGRQLTETRSYIFVTVHRYGNESAPSASLRAHRPA